MSRQVETMNRLEQLEARQLLSTTIFTQSSPIAIGTALGGAAVADFNGDKIPDIVVGPSGGSSVDVLYGKGKGKFGTPTVLSTQQSPFDIKVADFNGDGRPDIVTANYDGKSITVILNKGKGKWARAVNYTLPTDGSAANPFQVVTGDFNGDGKPDIAVSDPNNSKIVVWINKGNGTFGTPEQVRIPLNNHFAVNDETMKVADINGDGKLDLIFTETSLNSIGFALGDGKGGFTAENAFSMGSNPFDIAIGDFNGDKKVDIAVASHADNTITFRLGKGKGKFGAPQHFTTDAKPTTLTAGDFNGDGKLDLVVSSSDNGTVRVYKGSGKATFSSVQAFTIAGNATVMATGDVNKDGLLDLLVGGTGGTDGGSLTLLLSK